MAPGSDAQMAVPQMDLASLRGRYIWKSFSALPRGRLTPPEMRVRHGRPVFAVPLESLVRPHSLSAGHGSGGCHPHVRRRSEWAGGRAARALQLLIFFIVSGHAACLQTGVHVCATLMAGGSAPSHAAVIANFPVLIRPAGCGDDSFVAEGLPAHVLFAILREELGPVWAQSAAVAAAPCRCSIKTAVVHASRLADWSDAVGLALYGPGVCLTRGPYLGVSLGGRTAFLSSDRAWQKPSLKAVQLATWAAALGKILADCSAVVGTASVGLRGSF